MKVSINGRIEKIDEGFTIEENYNETLDSASIRISHLTSRWDIEPFDNAIIYQNDGETVFRKFCVNNFTCTEEAIGQNDTTYSYSINLFSLTKKLETIVLPNLSITPRKIGNKMKIYEYIFNLLHLYAPKHLYNGTYVSDWVATSRFINKFNNIDCPEMQWTTPTLREVLNDLTMLQDCIVILNQYEQIDYIDITQTTNVIKPYNYMQESRASEDYISEIRMELQNVMQTNVENINNTVTTTEYLTFTSNDSIITSDNCHLKTQFPILNIKHLWMIVACADKIGAGQATSADDFKTIVFKQDLCEIRTEYNNEQEYYNLVCEQKEYESKKPLYRVDIVAINNIAPSDDITMGNYYSKYRNFYVYFTRNSNIINGFSERVKAILSTETSTLYYLKRISALNAEALGILTNQYYGREAAYDINTADNSYFSTFFQIEYETTYNCVFQAGKKERPRNKRVIADNQTNAWVDAYSQGFLEYQKANRLGNLQRMYNQRVTDTSNLFVIGDKIRDKVSNNYEDVVYRTEYQIYKDHIECNAYATKNYVLQNYFTGIKSKIRTWVNAQEEAFIRHDLKKYYCEFSYTQNNEIIETINSGKYIASYLLLSITNNNTRPIKYVLAMTRKNYDGGVTTYWPSNTSKFALNCITRLIGNSIVLTAGFEDNWIVDKHPNTGTKLGVYDNIGVIKATDIKPISFNQTGSLVTLTTPYINYSLSTIMNPTIGGVATNYYKYCDEDGEFDTINLYYLDSLKISNYIKDNIIGHYNENDIFVPDNNNAGDFFIDIYNLPVVSNDLNDYYNFGVSLNLQKDNKEKPVISTQFEFCVNDDSIKFTKLFLQREPLIRDAPNNAVNIKLYDEEHNIVEGAGTITITSENEYCALITYSGTTANVKYVAICEGDNLILEYDITKNNRKLYLNIRRYY